MVLGIVMVCYRVLGVLLNLSVNTEEFCCEIVNLDGAVKIQITVTITATAKEDH